MCVSGRVATIVLFITSLSPAQDVRTATLVGTVTDPTGAAVPNANISVSNTDTGVVSHSQTTVEGTYYVPFLVIGNYGLTVEGAGFKKFLRTGIALQAGSTTRVDVQMEVGALNQEVQVTAASPLLATDSAAVGGLDDEKKVRETPMLQSKPQHLMYYLQGATALNDGSYHILGQPAALLNYTIDGASVKQSVRSEIGDTNTSITPPVDSIQEAQVWTTGIPAEVGHAAGGSYNIVLKSGTNQLHFATEERYINKDFIYRSYFQQSVANLATAPFEYHNFDAVLGGPVVLPRIYDGRNKTFFFLAYRLDYDHEANTSTTSTPDQAMLGGNFSFGGLGYPIYDPKSITCANSNGCAGGTGWTATAFPGNQILANRFDPVAVKFLSYHPYQLPNTTGFYSATGPNNNYTDLTHYLSDRQGYVAKFDQQIGTSDKLFVRYAWNKFRVVVGRNAIQYAWTTIDNTTFSYGLPEPIDERNVTLSEIHNFGPATVNESRVAYQRRNDNIYPLLNNQGWASALGIPGVGPQTFPGFVGASGGSSVTWSANPGGTNNPSGNFRMLNEDFQIADNVTRVRGTHTIKWGYQGILTRENDIPVSQPSGTYNFTTAGSGLPNTPNTGNTFASFLLGSVTSATFTTLLTNYLPRWGTHQLYVQDDWRATHNLTVNVGVRYSYETPANTKYGLKSQFDPTVTDPLTGLMGAITHPKGTVYGADTNNFAPRVGVSWNFKPKVVFRGSFGVFTQDVMPQLGQQEYIAQAAVQQPAGNPNPAFFLSQGPGPVTYNVNSTTGAANFVGTNYSSRNATYIDPHLHNPYTMTWSSGFQWQFKPNTLAEAVYQGAAGVGLVPSAGVAASGTVPTVTNAVNLNVLPDSIYASTNTTQLNTVYSATQNYLNYPQFGTITYISNYAHSTYHALSTRVEKRFSEGLSYNFLFTWSKNLAGTAGGGWQFYDWGLTKGPTTNDVKYAFVSQATYDLPVGKGRRYLNRAGVLDTIFGDWTLTTIQSLRTGLPVTFLMAGSPFKYLPGEVQPNIAAGQAINVGNYSVGPNLWPQANQNPFFNINAFSYPAAFTGGNAGVGVARAGGVWWPQYSITKSWAYREKFKITVRADAHNIFPKTRAFLSPNTTVNITSPQTFGKFAPATGYSFSNWFTPNPNFQGILRLEF
jgi:hypothetical protein